MVKREVRKSVIFRLHPDGHRLLKRQAVESDVSVQDIMVACCNAIESDESFRKRIFEDARKAGSKL